MNGDICTPQRPDAVQPTLRAALAEGTRLLSEAGGASARLDAEVLLRHAAQITPEALWLEPDRPIGARARELFRAALLRRARHEPVAYITGRKEFRSLDFIVARDVLVPRPETERLVEVAIELARAIDDPAPLKILDLGTGSGVVAVCLARALDAAEIWATDISAPALEIARNNSRRHAVDGRIDFRSGDLFFPIAEKTEFFDLMVSNPPYIPAAEIEALPPDIKDWEPRCALDGGDDGLDCYRRILKQAGRYLAAGGCLALEIGAGAGEKVSRLFAASGCFEPPSLYRDYAGRDRVIAARKMTRVGEREA